jgi:hypothetical protein
MALCDDVFERHVAPGANEDTARTLDGRKQDGLQQPCCNQLISLAEWTGLEAATPGVTGRWMK